MVPAQQIEAALAAAAARNPLMHLAADPAGSGPTAAAVFADKARMAQIVAAVGRAAGTSEKRVASSLVVMGYTTRLFGPALALLLAHGTVLDIDPGRLRLGYATSAGMRLTLAEVAGWSGDPQLMEAEAFERLHGHTAALVTAVRAVTPVAKGLLWGNAASSALGALRALGTQPPSTGGLAERLLRYKSFAGTGMMTAGAPGFLRRSCCLYYRLPRGGFCGDCPLPRRG